MDNDNYNELSAKATTEMANVLRDILLNRTIKERFIIGCSSIAHLLADFLDAIFLNEHTDKKIEMVDDVANMAKILLSVKEKIRSGNPSGSAH